MGEYSLRVMDLGKRYTLGGEAVYQVRDALMSAITYPIRAAGRLFRANGHAPTAHKPNTVWALRNVSFDVRKGEVVGIIGRNGAGKSTLLKILSRITDPTEGGADLYGRVGSLLEVGTGFHQEMSGRENVYMNGALLGMRKSEIDDRLDEIIAFAEVEDFIDIPVKRYSSGMYMRLAFAVAAHLEPEILIIDEVLAVGDAAFQKKCLGKMGDIAKHGRTVLFVSHNMAAVQSLCQRVVLLDHGRVAEVGPAQPIVQQYLSASSLDERHDREGDGSAHVTAIRIEPADNERIIRTGSRLKLTVEYRSEKPIMYPNFTACVYDMNNNGIYLFDSDATGGLPDQLPAKGAVTCVSEPLNITPGRCYVNIALRRGGSLADSVEYAAYFDVEPHDIYGSGRVPDRSTALCVLQHKWAMA
jgi:lipopolysaccharide transport system ATP-binding protein